MSNTCVVYLIYNTIVQKYYIGQTTRLASYRLDEHCTEKSNSKIHNAINKYGKQAFTVDILSECSSTEELNESERLWIILLDGCNIGYNIASGGALSFAHSEETKLEITKLCRTAWNRRGRIYITDGSKTRRISQQDKIPEGWRIGRAKFSESALSNIRTNTKKYHSCKKRAQMRVCYFCFKAFNWDGGTLGLFCSTSCSNKAQGLLSRS